MRFYSRFSSGNAGKKRVTIPCRQVINARITMRSEWIACRLVYPARWMKLIIHINNPVASRLPISDCVYITLRRWVYLQQIWHLHKLTDRHCFAPTARRTKAAHQFAMVIKRISNATFIVMRDIVGQEK